jgi:hypothetical protein
MITSPTGKKSSVYMKFKVRGYDGTDLDREGPKSEAVG